MHRESVAASDRNRYKTSASARRARRVARYAANPCAELVRNANYRASHLQQVKTVAADYVRRRMSTDQSFRLAQALRLRLRVALRSDQKTGSAVRDLGCTVPELKAHLEALFQPGMTWQNWSPTGWHIDHILPLASFDLTDREQFLRACHYTNLQPLWAEENLKKGARAA